MAKVDWLKIRNEYITTDTSYQALSQKYPVSKTAIANKAKKEGWVIQREEYRNETYTKIEQETQNIIVSEEVDRISKMLQLTDTAQEKIEEALTQLYTYIDVTGKECKSVILDVARLRKLVAALKDIKDIVKVDDKEGLDKLDAVLGKIEGNI